MKGLAQETIVKIIIGLVVLGVIVTLLYFGLGPFREAVQFNSCKARLAEWCSVKGDFPTDFGTKCGPPNTFGGRGTLCGDRNSCEGDATPGNPIGCFDV